MQHAENTFALRGTKSPDLIFGLDPLRVDHAEIIATNPEHYPAGRRAIAFRTLKEARGETVDPALIRKAFGLSVVGAA